MSQVAKPTHDIHTDKIVWGSVLFLSGHVSVIHAHVKSRRHAAFWRLACKPLRHHPKDALKHTRRPLCARCCRALTRAGVSGARLWASASKSF